MFGNCFLLSGNTFKLIGEKLKNLKALNVMYNDNITDDSVKLITMNNENLYSLFLESFWNLTVQGLTNINKLRKLRYLNIKKAFPDLTDDHVSDIKRNNKYLTIWS